MTSKKNPKLFIERVAGTNRGEENLLKQGVIDLPSKHITMFVSALFRFYAEDQRHTDPNFVRNVWYQTERGYQTFSFFGNLAFPLKQKCNMKFAFFHTFVVLPLGGKSRVQKFHMGIC